MMVTENESNHQNWQFDTNEIFEKSRGRDRKSISKWHEEKTLGNMSRSVISQEKGWVGV
jgi:hypothetical protein